MPQRARFAVMKGATAALILLASPCLASFPVAAQETAPTRILTVTGTGDRLVPATKAAISLGVQVEAPTAAAVQAQIAQRTNAIAEKLLAAQVEQLQTTGITLNPQYVYEGGKQRQTGFIGQSTVSFEIPVAHAGALLDTVVAAGANRIDRLEFVAAEPALVAARHAALQEAVKDAQQQAEVVLRSLGLKPQSIRTIQIGSLPEISPPVPAYRMAAQAAASVPTPIFSGSQRVRASVTLQITY